MNFISDYFNVSFEIYGLAPTKAIYSKMFYENALGCLMSEKLVLISNIDRCRHLFSKKEQGILDKYRNALVNIDYIVKYNEPNKEEIQTIVKTYEYILKHYGKAFEDLKNNYRANKGKRGKKND